MNSKAHYESLIQYHKSLLAQAEKEGFTEAAAYQRGMIQAYTLVLNTERG